MTELNSYRVRSASVQLCTIRRVRTTRRAVAWLRHRRICYAVYSLLYLLMILLILLHGSGFSHIMIWYWQTIGKNSWTNIHLIKTCCLRRVSLVRNNNCSQKCGIQNYYVILDVYVNVYKKYSIIWREYSEQCCVE